MRPRLYIGWLIHSSLGVTDEAKASRLFWVTTIRAVPGTATATPASGPRPYPRGKTGVMDFAGLEQHLLMYMSDAPVSIL